MKGVLPSRAASKSWHRLTCRRLEGEGSGDSAQTGTGRKYSESNRRACPLGAEYIVSATVGWNRTCQQPSVNCKVEAPHGDENARLVTGPDASPPRTRPFPAWPPCRCAVLASEATVLCWAYSTHRPRPIQWTTTGEAIIVARPTGARAAGVMPAARPRPSHGPLFFSITNKLSSGVTRRTVGERVASRDGTAKGLGDPRTNPVVGGRVSANIH